MLTILEGSTFCICDDIGDVGDETSGFFCDDTRFLSRLELRVDGERPLLLSSGKVEYFSAAFYLRNAPTARLPQDVVSVVRERFVGEGMQDHVRVTNETGAPLRFPLELELDADFADIITVKEHDFALGRPLAARTLPPAARSRFDADTSQFVLEEPEREGRTQVILSRPGVVSGKSVRFDLELAPRAAWDLRVDVLASLDGVEEHPLTADHYFGEERARVRRSLDVWHMRVPVLATTDENLQRAFSQSLADLAALRMRTGGDPFEMLPAAGMPWFMTVFGRDTIITCLQSMVLGPELAVAALGALAEVQAETDDASIDAEPGKIVHELRRGRAAETWFRAYYGTADATPLFLVLLSETWRWTGDDELARRLREPALAALAWIDTYGDRDGDGFVEYERRTARGLENQSWKDSGDSQRFHDGSVAGAPIAPVEVQGYVYDAKLRLAELARAAWRDEELAARLESDASELRRRFQEAFWLESRGGFYALALDGDKRPLDSLCSNIGHLLWSGIVPAEKVDAVADRLLSPELWSGWGIRTMSTADGGYNPLSYHNGTVWPHDSSLVAWGLARAGRREDMLLIARSLLRAAHYFDWSLPEVFAGFPSGDTPFPIAYPTAARPQAWAAGTPLLLLRLLLGLEPDCASRELRVKAERLPAWAGRVSLRSVRAFGRSWDVVGDDDHVTVCPS